MASVGASAAVVTLGIPFSMGGLLIAGIGIASGAVAAVAVEFPSNRSKLPMGRLLLKGIGSEVSNFGKTSLSMREGKSLSMAEANGSLLLADRAGGAISPASIPCSLVSAWSSATRSVTDSLSLI